MADEVLNYEDGFLMPGFNDYHVHMAMAAMMEYFGTVRATADEEEAARYLYERNKDRDKDRWILGGAWDHFIWPGQKLPSKESLDRYFPDTPVFSLNKECHGAWLNSEALGRFNITADTPDPPNGEYFRYEKGEPTGYIHEGAVAPLLRQIFDRISDEGIADFTRAFAKMANSLGVTSVADLPLYSILREDAYRRLQEKGDLTIRVNFSVGMMEDNEKIEAMRKEFTGPIVTFNGVKEFLDGTPMRHTGFLVEPYAGFGIMYVVVFLPFYGKTLPNVKVAAYGQILGVALFCVTTLFVMLAMFANIELMSEVQVPILALATNLSSAFGAFFAIIIMFGIYSSAVPLLYGPAIRFVDEKKASGKIVMFVLAMIGAFIPLFLPYNELMNIIYTANGYIGIIFIILVAVRVILRFSGKDKKLKKADKNE